jgi:hypothetical protein
MPSTVIRKFEYDTEMQKLQIVFTTGKVYVYKEVPESLYNDMRKAFSKGEFFNEHIRDKFEFEKIDEPV